jgi:hypothetical protein
VAFLVLWLVTQVGYAMVQAPEAFRGLPVDTDGFMRLVRVERLAETRDWWDGSTPRSNWPEGEVSHWTRPVDVLILALAAPARLFVDSREAIAFGGIILSPLLHLLAAVALFRAAAPLVPGPSRALVLPLFLLQAGLLSYGSAGRADHHMLILLLHVALLGAGLRMLTEPGRRGPAAVAGVVAAAGIWVSPEILLPLGILFAAQGVAWLLEGGEHPRAGVRLGLSLAMALVVALLVERGPAGAVTSLEYDRISRVHLEMALVATAFWALARWRWRERSPARGLRLAYLLVAAPLLVGGFVLLRPRFIRGPWVDVDPDVVAYWLRAVQELQPLLAGPWWRAAPEATLFLGPALVALPFAAWHSLRPAHPRRCAWVFVFLSLLVCIPLGIAQIRFTALAGPLLALTMAGVIGDLLRRQESIARPSVRRLARVGTMAGLTVGFLVVGMGLGAAGETWAARGEEVPGVGGRGVRDACPEDALARVLHDRFPEPRTVAAFMDLGPRILYATPHRVLATPYHRNRDGLLDARRIFRLPEGPELRTLLGDREVDLLLICPASDRSYYDPPEGSLYRSIEAGDLPSGIREVPLPPDAGDFRLVEMVDPGTS